ncbi:hypothetical protein [Gordonia asplenii]|uniref:hypothetical protein n=1 Tax=Gordonia asplenii TaxID=2725283 RepID=UPI001B7D696B|nr:hypothetical protein [Gordonia asplenii]
MTTITPEKIAAAMDEANENADAAENTGAATKPRASKASATKVVEPEPAPATSVKARIAGLRSRPISLQQLVTGIAALVLVVAIVVLSWQLIAKSDDLSSMQQAQADRAHAEQVALDYATGAAKMDYQDPAQWQGRLTKGTTPELADRLRKASTSMEQLIKPMQWTSTSEKLTAQVQSVKDGVYQVAAFVSVYTKNVQAPDGIESTATYKMTIDSNNNWVITEISGIPTSLGGDTSANNAAAPK